MPPTFRLKLPQLRVLRALRAGTPLTRIKICSAIGFSPGSGTLNYALNGMKRSAANPHPHPGLLQLGLICREELDIDGIIETVWRITESGLRYLECCEQLDSGLPDLRAAEVSTNRRYRSEK